MSASSRKTIATPVVLSLRPEVSILNPCWCYNGLDRLVNPISPVEKSDDEF
jgi:hypothetical protein